LPYCLLTTSSHFRNLDCELEIYISIFGRYGVFLHDVLAVTSAKSNIWGGILGEYLDPRVAGAHVTLSAAIATMIMTLATISPRVHASRGARGNQLKLLPSPRTLVPRTESYGDIAIGQGTPRE
jgi:hypothetical protein